MRSLVVFVATLGLTGCGGKSTAPPPEPSVQNSLKQIGVLYGRYASQHRGQSPKSLKEFRTFLEKEGAASLKAAVVDSVDQLLTSPRDKQPFVIRFGIKMKAPGADGAEIVAFEKTGESGKHFAVDSLGGVREIDTAATKKLQTPQ